MKISCCCGAVRCVLPTHFTQVAVCGVSISLLRWHVRKARKAKGGVRRRSNKTVLPLSHKKCRTLAFFLKLSSIFVEENAIAHRWKALFTAVSSMQYLGFVKQVILNKIVHMY